MDPTPNPLADLAVVAVLVGGVLAAFGAHLARERHLRERRQRKSLLSVLNRRRRYLADYHRACYAAERAHYWAELLEGAGHPDSARFLARKGLGEIRPYGNHLLRAREVRWRLAMIEHEMLMGMEAARA